MKFLLFLLGVIFFFIFFLFSKIQKIEGYFITNIFLQANIYIVIALVFVFILIFKGKIQQDDEEKDEDAGKKITLFSRNDVTVFIKKFFTQYIYYIALSVFYISIYFILHPFYPTLRPDIFLLVLNLLVVFLYFIEHKFEPFQDFIRVNLILWSLYYIGKHILYISWLHGDIFIIDLLNIIFLFILFFITFYSPRGSKYRPLISHTFIAFSFLEIAVLYTYFFSWGFLAFWILSWLIGFSLLFFTDAIYVYSTIKKIFIREWGVIFLWIFTIVSFFFLHQDSVLVYILIFSLFVCWYVLVLFHNRFSNYLAILVSSLSLSWALFGLYSLWVPHSFNTKYMYVFFFLLATLFLVIDIYRKKKHIYDEYFYRMYSLLVNIIWIFCFFFFTDVSILSVWIILLIESIYLFFSYYSFSKISSWW